MLYPDSYIRFLIIAEQLDESEAKLGASFVFGGNPSLEICLMKIDKTLDAYCVAKLYEWELKEIRDNYQKMLDKAPKVTITQEELDVYNARKKEFSWLFTKSIKPNSPYLTANGEIIKTQLHNP